MTPRHQQYKEPRGGSEYPIDTGEKNNAIINHPSQRQERKENVCHDGLPSAHVASRMIYETNKNKTYPTNLNSEQSDTTKEIGSFFFFDPIC